MTNQPTPEKIAPKQPAIPGELSLDDLQSVIGGVSAFAATNGGPPPKPPPPVVVNGRYNSSLKSRFVIF